VGATAAQTCSASSASERPQTNEHCTITPYDFYDLTSMPTRKTMRYAHRCRPFGFGSLPRSTITSRHLVRSPSPLEISSSSIRSPDQWHGHRVSGRQSLPSLFIYDLIYSYATLIVVSRKTAKRFTGRSPHRTSAPTSILCSHLEMLNFLLSPSLCSDVHLFVSFG